MPFLVPQDDDRRQPYVIGTPHCVIGRLPECEIVLNATSISRRHSRISFKGTDFFIEDLQSRHGTYVNGERVGGCQRLRAGDEIQIAEIGFWFQLEATDGGSEKGGKTARLVADQTHGSKVVVDDFRPTASHERLRQRADLLDRVRAFFKTRDFLEVETPLLSADTVVDRYLEPIRVSLGPAGGGSKRRSDEGQMWLQTSPEFCMKRLLASGLEAIFQVTKAFRRGEQGAYHNVEFSMLEWYRVGDTLDVGMQLLDELAQAMLGRGAAERISFRDAFQRHVELDPHTADLQSLRHAAMAQLSGSMDSLGSLDRDGLLNLLLAECVEPHLGREQPTILHDYPASQAALAVIRAGDPPVAERFELYVDGMELANGYHELVDPAELRERFEQINQQRFDDGATPLPIENRLFKAMEHGLPTCAGVALGFDRLVMVQTGARSIAEVIAFPLDRA